MKASTLDKIVRSQECFTVTFPLFEQEIGQFIRFDVEEVKGMKYIEKRILLFPHHFTHMFGIQTNMFNIYSKAIVGWNQVVLYISPLFHSIISWLDLLLSETLVSVENPGHSASSRVPKGFLDTVPNGKMNYETVIDFCVLHWIFRVFFL